LGVTLNICPSMVRSRTKQANATIAASVFLLFYRFWGLFPTVAQVAILIGSAFAAFFATLWVQAKDASGYFSKLAA
ncbi:hypothetical protein ACV34U_30210, partial [Pseudomonas aeruginosa]